MGMISRPHASRLSRGFTSQLKGVSQQCHEGVRSSNHHLAAWFSTGTVALIAFDTYTDFQYGQLASGLWGQVAFAFITAFIVAFFGIVGFRLIEHGLTEWSR